MAEPRLKILNFLDEKYKTSREYRNGIHSIEFKGYYEHILEGEDEPLHVKIYSPNVAYFLSLDEIAVRNMHDGTINNVESRVYLNAYIDGYTKGIEYFNLKYGKDSYNFVEDIRLNYFEISQDLKSISASMHGWSGIKRMPIYLLSKRIMGDYGYYSGVVSQTEEVVGQYPSYFKGFYTKEVKNKHPEVFTDEGFQVFLILDEKYPYSDNTFTKYSLIGRYLYNKHLLANKQKDYIELIARLSHEKFTRIESFNDGRMGKMTSLFNEILEED